MSDSSKYSTPQGFDQNVKSFQEWIPLAEKILVEALGILKGAEIISITQIDPQTLSLGKGTHYNIQFRVQLNLSAVDIEAVIAELDNHVSGKGLHDLLSGLLQIPHQNREVQMAVFCKSELNNIAAYQEALGYRLIHDIDPELIITCLYPDIQEMPLHVAVITLFEESLEGLGQQRSVRDPMSPLMQSFWKILSRIHANKVFHGDLWLRNVGLVNGRLKFLDTATTVKVEDDFITEVSSNSPDSLRHIRAWRESLAETAKDLGNKTLFTENDFLLTAICRELYLVFLSSELQKYFKAIDTNSRLEFQLKAENGINFYLDQLYTWNPDFPVIREDLRVALLKTLQKALDQAKPGR